MSLSGFFWPGEHLYLFSQLLKESLPSKGAMKEKREKGTGVICLLLFLFLEKAYMLWFPEDLGKIKTKYLI